MSAEKTRETIERIYESMRRGESIGDDMAKVIEEEKRRIVDEYRKLMEKRQETSEDAPDSAKPTVRT